MFCVAFGLSMDYEVFLISRMNEFHDNGAPHEAGIARGMSPPCGTRSAPNGVRN